MNPGNVVLTDGGFPFHMDAISRLFDKTVVVVPMRNTIQPSGLRPLKGHNLTVHPISEPNGTDLRRKLALIGWLPRNILHMWREIRKADVVHTPVPGDIGSIGLMIALLQRKRLFVRHCGTWGEPVTIADRLLLWLLEKIAGDRNAVLATGGASQAPSKRNPAIKWIFSTSITEQEWQTLPQGQPWTGGDELRLITVGRVTEEKNARAIIDALPHLRKTGLRVTLDIVGEGPDCEELQRHAVVIGGCEAEVGGREAEVSRSEVRRFGGTEVGGQRSEVRGRRTEVIESVDRRDGGVEIGDRRSEVGDQRYKRCICFHGNVSHERVMELLSQSHIFVFPTRVKEGFPKALLEAMACGLPSIATGVSVIPELLKDDCGMVLRGTTSEDVATAVTEMVKDTGRMAAMGRNARQKSHDYTLERWIEDIREFLNETWGGMGKE